VIHYVPNNDLDAVDGDLGRIEKIRAEKVVRPTLLPDGMPVFLYAWPFDDGLAEARMLCLCAERLHTFGRGVDAAFARASVITPEAGEHALERHGGAVSRPGAAGSVPCPAPGSLDSLKARHAATARRLQTVGTGRQRNVLFRQPPKPLFRPIAYDSPPARLLYALRRADAPARYAPVPRTDALPLTQAVRDRAAERLSRAVPGMTDSIARFLVGRGAAAADATRRVRILPLPTIGHEHASPSIRRIVVEIPADCPLRPRDLDWALSGLDPFHRVDAETGEVTDGASVLVPAEADSVTAGYGFEQAARRWRSVTPVVLSRPPGRAVTGAERVAAETQTAAAVSAALRHAGVAAQALEVRLQREPFDPRGERAERFASGRFCAGHLRHLELLLDRPVRGPLALGDGRFLGLGLLRPVPTAPPGVHVFAVDAACAPAASLRETTLRALRRAVMALAQAEVGARAKLPALFHGHDDAGAAARPGQHAHLFYAGWSAAGGERLDRLAVIAPHLADRTVAPSSRGSLALLARALEHLRELRAGRAGRLSLAPVDAWQEPLFTIATTWTSLQPYRPTRYPGRQDPAAGLMADILAECARRGLPRPAVEVMHVERGPRGGLSARLRLRFAVGVEGPILLGRDSHFGGGLFVGHAMEPGQGPLA
jgi:CRISPR-associated protein Csb2